MIYFHRVRSDIILHATHLLESLRNDFPPETSVLRSNSFIKETNTMRHRMIGLQKDLGTDSNYFTQDKKNTLFNVRKVSL